MKCLQKVIVALVKITLFLPVIIYSQENTLLKVQELCDRIIAISAQTGNYRIVAINSEAGLVVIDSQWSPGIAEEVKNIITKRFGRDDIRYLINTTDDILCTGGNQAYADAVIVSHQKCRDQLEMRRNGLIDLLQLRSVEFEERVKRSTETMKSLESNSNEAKFLEAWLNLCQRIADDQKKAYEIVLPHMTFNDRMTLDLGDMTMELIYFGEASSEGDILVRIPEERLLVVGDLFHFWHVLPLAESEDVQPDVRKWIEVLDEVLYDHVEIKHVVCSNSGAIWSRKELEARYRLIRDIWEKVQSEDSQHQDLQSLLDAVTNVETMYPYVMEWETYKRIPDLIRDDIVRTVTGIWRQSHMSAAKMLSETLNNEGAEGAIRVFTELQSDSTGKYYILEEELNGLGYRLLEEDRMDEALCIFKFNAETFPESWNVYDSLAEAYMKRGDTQLAITNYKKSLRLNTENNNAREMLKRLEMDLRN